MRTQIPILLNQKSWIAVDKPAGLSVHNVEDPENLLLLLQKQLGVSKVYPVHRLDKETSGLQILALDERTARDLAEDFQSRNVKKVYRGILRGNLKQSEGVWKIPLTDKSEGRKNPAGLSKDRVPCETRFRTLEKSPYFTYCEFDLITGRQHQIRKHTALENHALVGDSRYGDSKYNEKIASFYKTDRMFLHCFRLEIAGHALEAPVSNLFTLLIKG